MNCLCAGVTESASDKGKPRRIKRATAARPLPPPPGSARSSALSRGLALGPAVSQDLPVPGPAFRGLCVSLSLFLLPRASPGPFAFLSALRRSRLRLLVPNLRARTCALTPLTLSSSRAFSCPTSVAQGLLGPCLALLWSRRGLRPSAIPGPTRPSLGQVYWTTRSLGEIGPIRPQQACRAPRPLASDPVPTEAQAGDPGRPQVPSGPLQSVTWGAHNFPSPLPRLLRPADAFPLPRS